MTSESRSEKLASSLAVFVLFAFALALGDVARRISATHDEVAHLAAGAAYLETGEALLNPEHPPLVKLVAAAGLRAFGVRADSARELFSDREHAGAAQWAAGERLVFADNPTLRLPFETAGAASVLLAARLPLLVFPLALALVVYLWARARHGPWGGLVGLVLVGTYPDLLGHGPLVATDVPLAAFAVGAGFALDRLARGAGARALVALALLVGGALASKFTALLLVPSLGLAAALVLRAPLDSAPASLAHPLGAGTPRAKARALALALAVVLVGACAVVSLAYFGNDPVRLYREGIAEATLHHPRPHEGYLLGAGGRRWWWFYFPVVLALRFPLGSLAALGLAAALGVGAARRPRGAQAPSPAPSPWSDAALLLAPGLAFFALTAALAPPMGSRYLLPAVPFLCVAAGILGSWARASRGRGGVVALLLLGSIAGAVVDHPGHASALDRLAGPLTQQWKVEANEDWGGGFLELARWQRAARVPSLEVVPFRAEVAAVGSPAQLALSWIPWQTHFEAYGVRGELRGADVLYSPEKGKVYAVSARALAQALVHDAGWREASSPFAGKPPALVLGGEVQPTAAVDGGAILIFDRR